jgi:hypothetical protein
VAKELLNAGSLKEFEQLAQQKQMTADPWPPKEQEKEAALPPETYHPATMGKEQKTLKELGESGPVLDHRSAERLLAQQERPRLQPIAPDGSRVQVTPLENDPRAIALPKVAEKLAPMFGRMGRRLGSNQIWNVLHQFRGLGEDSAVEKEKFDQLAFGAILLLSLLGIIIMVLVQL